MLPIPLYSLMLLVLSPNLAYSDLVSKNLTEDQLKFNLGTPEDGFCAEGFNGVFILVRSAPVNLHNRNRIRRLYGREKTNAISVIFLVDKPYNESILNLIIIENNIYKDMIISGYTGHYRNETYTHLLGLWWISTECLEPALVIKLGDDHVKSTLDYCLNDLDTLYFVHSPMNFIMGNLVKNGKPVRDVGSPKYISEDEYDYDKYPDYLCDPVYMTTPLVAARIVKEAVKHPYFPIHDVFVTGMLPRALGLNLLNYFHGSSLFDYFYEYLMY